MQARRIKLNGKEIEVVKFGDIADVKQGLATGDNHAYLFQNLMQEVIIEVLTILKSFYSLSPI